MQNTAIHTFMNPIADTGTRVEPIPKTGQGYAFTTFLEPAMGDMAKPPHDENIETFNESSPLFPISELFEETPTIIEGAAWAIGQDVAVPLHVPTTKTPVNPAAPIAMNAKSPLVWHDMQFLEASRDGAQMAAVPLIKPNKTHALPTSVPPIPHGQVAAPTIPASLEHPIPKTNAGAGEFGMPAGNTAIAHHPATTDNVMKEGGSNQIEPNKATDHRVALSHAPDKPDWSVEKAAQTLIATSNSPNTQQISPNPESTVPSAVPTTHASTTIPNLPSLQGSPGEPEPSPPPQENYPQKQTFLPAAGENTAALLSGTGPKPPEISAMSNQSHQVEPTKPVRATETIRAKVTPIKTGSDPIPAFRETADQTQASLSVSPLIINDKTGLESITIKQEPALARQIASQITQVAQPLPSRPVELVLNPEELGRVRLSFTTENGALTVSVTTERPETLDLMRRHIDALAQDLRNIGYRQVSFGFGQDGANNGASTSDQFTNSSETSTPPKGQAQADPMDDSTGSPPHHNALANSASGVDLRL